MGGWASVLLLILAAGLSGCATVPMTGRSGLSLVSDGQMVSMGVQQCGEVLKEAKLSKNGTQVAMVRRVGERIARAAEDFLRERGAAADIASYQWEFNLIDDDKTVNAWCMPGGKVAVYTGLLPVTRDETGLAIVLGHEVAHAIAKHGNERMSQALLAQLGGVGLSIALSQKPQATQELYMAAYGVTTNVRFMLPYSRLHESEADRIGLSLMARAVTIPGRRSRSGNGWPSPAAAAHRRSSPPTRRRHPGSKASGATSPRRCVTTARNRGSLRQWPIPAPTFPKTAVLSPCFTSHPRSF
jgi:predicted Zn-dependent protease